MKFLLITLYLVILIGINLLFGAIDVYLYKSWGLIVQIYPILLLSLFFLTYHQEKRWWIIFLSIVSYSFVSNVPLIGIFVFTILLFALDAIMNKLFQRRTFFYLITFAFFTNAFFYITKKITPYIYDRFYSWSYIVSRWEFGDLNDFFLNTLLIILMIILLYPLISLIDTRKSLYTNN